MTPPEHQRGARAARMLFRRSVCKVGPVAPIGAAENMKQQQHVKARLASAVALAAMLWATLGAHLSHSLVHPARRPCPLNGCVEAHSTSVPQGTAHAARRDQTQPQTHTSQTCPVCSFLASCHARPPMPAVVQSEGHLAWPTLHLPGQRSPESAAYLLPGPRSPPLA